MTREEKINTLKAIIQECEDYQWQRKETLFEIIKALEQTDVLDKIRAEIEANNIYDFIAVQTALDIIDKYRKAQSNADSD